MSKRGKSGAGPVERSRMSPEKLIAFRDRRTGRMRWIGSVEALHRPAQDAPDGEDDLPDLDLLIALKGRRN